MIHLIRFRVVAALAVALAFPATGFADADSAPGPEPASGEPPKPHTNGVLPLPAVARPSPPKPDALPCNCKAPRLPVYVENWSRLADLTREDPEVFDRADFWRSRQDGMRWLLGGMLVGGGAATLATIDRLGSGSWNDGTKWMLAGGLGLALFSGLARLAFSPDRDDLLTVVNHWNLRHADRPLAP